MKTISISFLLLVLCGCRSRDMMNNQDREQGSSVPKPLSPTDSALKFTGTGGKFHLTCVVF